MLQKITIKRLVRDLLRLLSSRKFFTIDGEWKSVAKHLRDWALKTIGKQQKKNQNCFNASDKDIKSLIDRHRLMVNSKPDARRSKEAHQKLRYKVRELKNIWASDRS